VGHDDIGSGAPCDEFRSLSSAKYGTRSASDDRFLLAVRFSGNAVGSRILTKDIVIYLNELRLYLNGRTTIGAPFDVWHCRNCYVNSTSSCLCLLSDNKPY